MSFRNPGLTIKLKVGQIFWTKAILINILKRWHVKSSLQYKVQCSTTIYVQLQYKHEPTCQWYMHGGYHKNSNSFDILKLKESYTCHDPMVMQAHC